MQPMTVCTARGASLRSRSRAMRSERRILRLSVLLPLLLPATASADLAGKADSFLSVRRFDLQSAGWVRVIARLSGPLDADSLRALQGLRADVYRHLPSIQSVAIRVPSRSVARLAAFPVIARLSADTAVRKSDEFTVQSSGADAAFEVLGLTGRGVGIAIVDSGIARMDDLDESGSQKSRVAVSVDFVSGGSRVEDPCGHGTHIAGIAAGNGCESSGKGCFRTFYGIAREARLVDIRVLDRTGTGLVSDAIAGIQWAIDHRTQYQIRVLNLSLGHPVGESYSTDPLCRAAEAAWKSGIVVV